jgi:LacI family transcriptional regulator
VRVPEDVSVMGFDDVHAAAYMTPSLTTIRQPLEDMGRIAARIALSRIRGEKEYGDEVAVEPSLIVRESTRELS